MIISIFPSDKKGFKWMAQVDVTGQKIYFGNSRWGDFTTHKDEKKRKQWMAKNKDIPWDPKLSLNLTPQWLNRHLLWEKDDMNKALGEASILYPNVKFRWGVKKIPPPPPPPQSPPPKSPPPPPPQSPPRQSPPRGSPSPARFPRPPAPDISRPRMPRAQSPPPAPRPPSPQSLEDARRELARLEEQLRAARNSGDTTLVYRLNQQVMAVRAWIQREEGRR